MKYPEKQFELYDKNCFSTTSWHDLFAGRRVLVCSLTRSPQVFLQDYVRNLSVYAEMYYSIGIDQVYLITTSGLACMGQSSKISTLPVLGDIDQEFTKYLNAQINNNNHNALFLTRFWNYQVLINDGEIEQITQQPLDNYLVTMLKETKNVRLVRDLGLKNDTLIWTPTFLSRTINAARDVYYFRLHPNIALKKHLFKKD